MRKVLLVDDDDGVRAMMTQMLERKGFEVVSVARGDTSSNTHCHGKL